MTPTADLLEAAVANNVAWCSTVCTTETTDHDDGVWVTASPHPLFPDLVTTRAAVAPAAVAAPLAERAQCSVKDSYADLDLAPHGFTVLFDASWIGTTPTARVSPPRGASWPAISTAADLTRWSAAAGLPVSLPAEILTDVATAVLADSPDQPTRGAVVTRSGTAAGVSNIFGPSTGQLWPAVITAASTRAADLPLVGYESGADLAAARAAGFTVLGPLRVWIRNSRA